MKKGSGTRSGLLWEVERILKDIRDGGGELPQILFMENVPQVHADANMVDFQNWIDFLTSLGYVSYWQDLNAKKPKMQLFAAVRKIQLRRITMQSQNIKVYYDLVE